ncbi:hypothetical protein AN2291.2 [Aspergillus nidulans FGSC A4]|uniref:Transposase Tan1-Aspergillus niger (ANG_orthologue An07g09460) n=1 Tax=Emericella nidulans (strain FGSC A4 / ATCC 38163 / CBS 112.46 / NRRL 194 / M139) TaxID=227321 RepID=Q5BAY9_EMENI|nr:hypothetical protein [Aspergillus nidulans FGSC A4]EAA64402.1 hypothetical protein AN2291.2 [Aspergillus nidulans FGSC A4]CBF86544.1 TPA: transposase Tan1-Aspergillus niger (ANG_orthologue; An07g09460) [Aspergillus nidulans FGSC A4]|eukprot:XP_659895.1 hypothetical protein AN2291.2 [Aspergillus nidulans FGSC A4]
MPRVRVSSSQNCHEKEGRLLLAVQAIKKKEITSIREAARRFNVPESTLRTRLRGTTNRAESRANGHKLTEIEEEVLKQWILSLDLRGAAPTKAHVREMANILLAKRGSTPIQTVGQKWVYNYTQRHPELESRLSRQYDCQRAKQENPKVIQAWFNTVRATIEQYGILPDDIYNFDETGFAMGLCAHQKVITKSESCGRRPVLQPGNCEWVTAIESISASGWALPPTLIFKGKQYNQAWFTGLPPDWRFEISTNGWTTNEISLRWLQKQFIPSTEHLFEAAGLVPLNPEPVLSKLSIQARTPTPPGSRGSQASTFCPHTPANVDELLKQASLLRDFLKQRSKSPPSPSHNALNQLIKGCQIAMQKGILLEQENRALRAERCYTKAKASSYA